MVKVVSHNYLLSIRGIRGLGGLGASRLTIGLATTAM